MKLKIKKLHPDAVVPQYQTAGAACFDLHALDPVKLPLMIGGNGSKAATFGTGLEIEVPQDHVMLIFSRSGHAFAHDVRLANCVGVIDSDYRGEIKVRLAGDTKNQIVFRSGDRIAQAMIVPIPRVEFEVVEELTTTERGTGGFGSTGA